MSIKDYSNKKFKGERRRIQNHSSPEKRPETIDEVVGSKEEKKEGRELWCTECGKEGYTKGACPKKAFCEIY